MSSQVAPPHVGAALAEFAAGASVDDVRLMAGNAGFSYGFELGGSRFVLRVPPPGVRHSGPADVLRQARIIEFLQKAHFPVAELVAVGDGPDPWFVVERLDAVSIRPTEDEPLPAGLARALGLEAADRLRDLHRLRPPGWLGERSTPLTEITRWDWMRERVDGLPSVAEELIVALQERLPDGHLEGILHGDYQWGNILGGEDGVAAIIDWELSRVGPVLVDLGWLTMFSDRGIWDGTALPVPTGVPDPGELARRYGASEADMAWYRALAGSTFAVIMVWNFGLHRSGKRHDPLWQELEPVVPRLLEASLEALTEGEAR